MAEETGVAAELEGVVSMRHAHGRRFGVGDLYVLVRLKAASEAITLDEHELADARWFSEDEMEAMREQPEDAGKPLDGKISSGNFDMIHNALHGKLIEGVSILSSKGVATMMYRAPRD